MSNLSENAVAGCLLGTAVGDAIGLPYEGLTRARQRRLYPRIEGHRLLAGRGMVSDDTEHACMVAQALIASGGDPQAFPRELARRLRVWLLGAPAGVGFATLKATLRLCVGIPPERSGVFSAGNGPAMRAPLLGVCWGHDPERLRALVRASTRVTHTDPKAEYGALAVAVAAHVAAQSGGPPPGEGYLARLAEVMPDEGAEELVALLRRATQSAAAGESTEAFAAGLGLARGISGYVYHTVPAAVHAWLRHPGDYAAAVRGVVRCGGDSDTTAAIAGGIVGAGVGKAGIPEGWLAGVWEWPRSVAWLEALAGSLAGAVRTGVPARPPELPWALLAPRNILFLAVVLGHGFRRMLPPYGGAADGE